MLKIWGRLNSVNVQKVVFCAAELGLPFERHDAGMAFGVVDTPAYRAMNPNGLVPLIEEDGVTVWESNAIIRYLAARHGKGGLWPTDPGERSQGDRWMDWASTVFVPAYSDAFRGLIRTPKERRNELAIEASRQATEKALAVLEAHLANRAWLAGEEFSIGDIALGPIVHRWFNLPIRRESRPAALAWVERLRARPAAASFRDVPLT
jgi:glutathione S-transferase